jgi:cell division septation protein DedD
LKVTIAFQHFQQLSDKLKNSVAGQTSVKYAGGLSYQDSRFLANEMRCEPDFLTSLKTDISHPPKWTQFAVYADNWNDNHSMLLTLPFFTMEREPKMTPDQYAAMLSRNRQRIAPAAQVIQKPQTSEPKRDMEHASAPEPPKATSEPAATAKAHAKQQTSAPTDPHLGDHTEPASKWGDQ